MTKRRTAGKLRKITNTDRDKRIAHDLRTGRYDRVFTRKKVMPVDKTRVREEDRG